MAPAPIKVGFIGLSTSGWASTHHAPALSDAYQLVALCTSKASTAAAASAHYGPGIKGYHGDPAQLAEDPSVDLVVVAIHLTHHKASVWPAIAAGKDVFVEWPLARNLEEAREIERFAREKGVRTMVGLQARQGAAVRRAKALVESGAIGRVLSTTVLGAGGGWDKVTDESHAYIFDQKIGVNLLTVPLAHTLDALTYVLGEFVSLSATAATRHRTITVLDSGRTIEQTTADHIAVQGTLESGVQGTHESGGGVLASVHFRGAGGFTGGGFAKQGSEDFFWEIEGEEGLLVLKGPSGHIQMVEPTLYLNGEKVDVGDRDPLALTRREYAEFAKGPGGEYVDFAHAVKRHAMIDAIERSAKEGKVTTYI
ncbi:hypothetical protein PLICRDRAFT_45665 [Plicaturopsis crispa FD-325 SS-3]|uniref:Gfo/Idh/MocA-like oxidoreductase N-terminal domain-containing protein n=1 Tax=Plicaturopsis crispa FD-325 SS-3 TaxID=944288 RepID=A0A0C9SY75_PLICR|nr:hypothetical protein PLICRDRAFT_45665 [Plicaturopsis crispa FD-325 SS-3]